MITNQLNPAMDAAIEIAQASGSIVPIGIQKERYLPIITKRFSPLTQENTELKARVGELELHLRRYQSRYHGAEHAKKHWDEANAALSSTPSSALQRLQELERYNKAMEWMEKQSGETAFPIGLGVKYGGYYCTEVATLDRSVIDASTKPTLLEAIESAIAKQQEGKA